MATRVKEKIPAQFRRSVRGWEVPMVLDISNAEWEKIRPHIHVTKQGRYDMEEVYDWFFGPENVGVKAVG